MKKKIDLEARNGVSQNCCTLFGTNWSTMSDDTPSTQRTDDSHNSLQLVLSKLDTSSEDIRSVREDIFQLRQTLECTWTQGDLTHTRNRLDVIEDKK